MEREVDFDLLPQSLPQPTPTSSDSDRHPSTRIPRKSAYLGHYPTWSDTRIPISRLRAESGLRDGPDLLARCLVHVLSSRLLSERVGEQLSQPRVQRTSLFLRQVVLVPAEALPVETHPSLALGQQGTEAQPGLLCTVETTTAATLTLPHQRNPPR